MISDFIYDHPVIFFGGCALFLFGIFTLGFMKDEEFRNAHTCVREHQQYSPPIYVKSGSVMVPVGGGMTVVCDEWVANE